ncbi:MAG: zinc ribbon domain-containing protein [Candidatus Hodarchaeota archaeon]
MIRRVVLNLNHMTEKKRKRIHHLIDEYLPFVKKVINSLWNHQILAGRFCRKEHYQNIKTSLTERYKQCAAKQALQIVKSQRKRLKRTKPTVHSPTLELDSRFSKIEEGKNTFDLWVKISILDGRPILIPARRHHHFNSFYNSSWRMKRSSRLRKTKKGLFLDVFFEKQSPQTKGKGRIVGLDLGFRKLAVLSDGQVIGKGLNETTKRFHKRKKSHLVISEYINQELKEIDFSDIRILVIEGLKNVKKGKRGKNSRYANRLLSHWAYRHALFRLEMLCEENRVQLMSVNPRGTSKACNKCGGKGIRRDERFMCPECGWKVDADYNAALNIRDRFILRGVYGPLSKSHFDIPFG